ncbi:MAG: hypothetical protein N2110_10515, partial [Flavobacteriales bacterium]|nr:hypothetical protein [Flavobacteriales bacterium]
AIRMPDGVFIPANTPLDINTLSRIREQYPESYQGAVGAKLYSLGFSQVAGKTAVFAVPFEEISNQAYAVYGRAVDKMINDLVKNFEENLHVKPRFINFEKRFEVK